MHCLRSRYPWVESRALCVAPKTPTLHLMERAKMLGSDLRNRVGAKQTSETGSAMDLINVSICDES